MKYYSAEKNTIVNKDIKKIANLFYLASKYFDKAALFAYELNF